jgi:inorganic pyrophosphatase
MTDETSEGTFEEVGPANADIANTPLDYVLHTHYQYSVGDVIRTSKDGLMRVVDGGRHGTYFVQRIEQDTVDKNEQIHDLDQYGIDYR